MSDLPLGKIIEGEEQRDAIHIAVAPVIAAERLVPGGHIGFVRDGDTEHVSARAKVLIGIVDPFLTAIVEHGQRCWMFLYPQTITSLRHDWTHPAFKSSTPSCGHDAAAAAASQAWLCDFAARYGMTADAMVAAAEEWERDGEFLCRGGTFEGEYVPDEFWKHYQAVTGKVPIREGSFFTCSC